MKRSCKDIRSEFIAFFEERGHTFVPSSSLLPAEDPTLLFTNAGMNQFKEIFLGRESRDYNRVANTQKCIRAGGKHNDLEDVGHDTYHHTFFEMLGNWSFGNYFKKEAIQWAWELLTDVWGLPKGRLYATVFGGDEADGLAPDEEAEGIWAEVTDIDPAHIRRFGKKDNFWEMGATGPCGPCSEIHIDMTPDGSGAELVNADDPRVIELWNLVFIQFNRDASGKLTQLPAQHVDTGMGLERVVMVMQGKRSNYATDLFRPIIEKIETMTAHRYGAAAGLDDRFNVSSDEDFRQGDVACRVVADHARALTFAIADGIIPSNEGRGYVLRRILRRAARYGRQYLQIDGEFVCELVATVVEMMGDVFGELRDRQEYVMATIRSEEESFGRTLDRGIDLFQRQADRLAEAGQTELPGEVAFDLYSTYGFPLDLTQIMADERQLTVDVAGYEAAMARHREVSGAGEASQTLVAANLPATDASSKYGAVAVEASVLGWVCGEDFITEGELETGQRAAVVLDRTNFYGEQGGQMGDSGRLTWPGGALAVEDTQLAGDCTLHVGVVETGALGVGQTVRCEVSAGRMDVMRNHTGTHLLNGALREVLGDHVHQAGSVVAPDRMRFDFTHNHAVTAEELSRAEQWANERILDDLPVRADVMPLAEAQKIRGVRAVFGEKYPDPVRVIRIGGEGDDPISAEFCGGTHLERTGQVALLKILSDESVAKGVRRITAVTGRSAMAHVRELDGTVKSVSVALRAPMGELASRVAAMQQELKQLRKRPAAGAGAKEFEATFTIASSAGDVLVGRVEHADAGAMRSVCDRQRQKGAAAVFVGGVSGGKVMLVAMVSDSLVASGQLHAGQWVRAVAPVVDGGGGGKATLAQAGGKRPEKLDEALAAAAQWAGEKFE